MHSSSSSSDALMLETFMRSKLSVRKFLIYFRYSSKGPMAFINIYFNFSSLTQWRSTDFKKFMAIGKYSDVKISIFGDSTNEQNFVSAGPIATSMWYIHRTRSSWFLGQLWYLIFLLPSKDTSPLSSLSWTNKRFPFHRIDSDWHRHPYLSNPALWFSRGCGRNR